VRRAAVASRGPASRARVGVFGVSGVWAALWRSLAAVVLCVGYSAPVLADAVASCIRLVALSEINGRPWTSVAELDLIDATGQRLAKAGWTLVSVDSQELAGEDGRATNAFDGSAATIWHTEWLQASPPPPHRIDINLGGSRTLRALEYLPRQSGSVNGTIASFEVYASQNCTAWTRVAAGIWASDRTVKTAQLNDGGNTPPTVAVTAPANGAVFASNAIITFTGTASDAQDGNLASSLSWRSSLSGALGSGATLSTSLAAGTHVITASATDTGGMTGSAAITIVVGTQPPQPSALCVRLLALSEVNGRPWTSAAEIDVLNATGQRLPKTGWTVIATDSQEVVGEDGQASNAIDGATETIWHTQWLQASPPPPHRIDIRFASQQNVSGIEYLPRQDGSLNGTIAGYEVYTSSDCVSWARVAQGAWAANANRKTASFSTGGNAQPTVSITAPTDNSAFLTTDVVRFTGTASDAEDGSLSAGLSWRSSIGGLLGTGSTLSTTLSAGSHVVTASATDSGGATGSAAVTVVVSEPSAQILARCVRLVALSEINGRPWTSAAEVDVLNAANQRLPKTGWTASVDSEELSGEDGRASNAIDGSTGTIWHTQWLQASPPPPHRIDINLGSPQSVAALEYLPRQDGTLNGTIAAYEVYTSADCSVWTRVAQGTWAATAARKSTALADVGAPIANAGVDRSAVAGSTVALDGSASRDPNGTITAYQWSQTAGPTVALAQPNAVTTTFTAPAVAAVLTFQLRVTDNSGNSAVDTVDVTVTGGAMTTNQVAVENRLPGTSAWRLTNPAESRQIEGFASATSVNRGDPIALFVNTSAATFQLEVFRMGWYQGLGGRRVLGPVTVNGTAQSPPPAPNGTTGLVDVNWINPYVLDTEFADGAPWRTGVYLAKLTENQNGNQSYIIFVVRDDAHAAEVLFGLPVTTYQSYNAWGGKSLYQGQSGAQEPWGSTSGQRAVKVSFNRPYAASVAPGGWYGVGAGEFLTNLQPLAPNPDSYPISGAGWDYNMVRWLEYEQYDVGYVTNIDYHRTNTHTNGVEVFLSPGHDEYWTWQMFDNIQNARDGGVDLAFFSANTAFRQIRFESSNNSLASGASPEQSQRIMVHYREVPDPILSDGNPSNDYLATVEFRSSPVNRPEQDLIGVQYVLAPVDGDIVVSNAAHPVFARTGLVNGARLAGLLGYEVDMRFGSFGNVVELASSPFTILRSPFTSGTSHMTIYTAGSGAQVFATGSIQWSWGLDDFNGPSQGGLRSSRLSAAAQQITDNVLERFGATPYVPNPVRAQCVQLRAMSNVSGNASWASAAEIDLLGADGRELARTQWSITADSQETAAENNAAANAIDGNVNTIWHSAWSSGAPPLPHTLTINLGTALDVSALRYLPRQDGGSNGTIAGYEVHVASSCTSPTWTRVAEGTFLETPTANSGRKTARFFP
jgi:hypothetical protein